MRTAPRTRTPAPAARAAFAVLAMLAMLAACSGRAEPATAEPEPATAGTSSAGASTAEDAPRARPTPPPPLSADASDDARQAEYWREEVRRLEVQLEGHLGREDIPCEDAASTRDEICDLASRICALGTDADIRVRCDYSRQQCGEAREVVAAQCGGDP